MVVVRVQAREGQESWPRDQYAQVQRTSEVRCTFLFPGAQQFLFCLPPLAPFPR